MSNPYFQFKQFTVFHDQCAMKVGTDGVLLGSWVNCVNACDILDVGSGSGLISLMLAQRSKATIHAIDIDEGAFRQTLFNARNSSFSARITASHCSFQDYNPEKTFDLIISNPPFFINSLKAPDNERNLVRHDDHLPLEKLISKSISLLSPQGRIALILPYDSLPLIEKIAEDALLFNIRKTAVKTTPQKEPKRVLLEYSLEKPASQSVDTLCIELLRHVYSPEFKTLIKDFYLK